jgi:pimeloyl-ACP methyl ester carboxylesterase
LFAPALALCIANSDAGTCTADVNEMDRGERRPVLVCGAGIPPGYVIEGLADAGFTIEYRQFLKRCAPDLSEPGLYLWLRAAADARPARLTIRDGTGGSAVCENLQIAVPDRELLAPARLEPLANGGRNAYLLEVATPAGSRSGVSCASVLEFPPGKPWPQLRLLTPDEVARAQKYAGVAAVAPLCERHRMQSLVEVTGEQRLPAKVVVRTGAGRTTPRREAIAWAALPDPAWYAAMPGSAARYVDVDGYRTRYFEDGDGDDTVILVHGGQPDPVSPTAESWRQNFPGLAAGFRVIAYDTLGSGLTDNPRTADDYLHYYERVAGHLYGLIKALGLQRVHLVGHSQGGWPVLRVALDHPEVVSSVVSVDSVMAPFGGKSGQSAVSRFGYLLLHVTPAEGPTVASLLREHLLSAATWNNMSWSQAELRVPFAQLEKLAEARAALQAVRMSPGHPAFRELRRRALTDLEAGLLRVPHLLVWGYQDPLAPVDLGLEMLRIASHSPAPTQMAVINEAGHSPHLEQPGQFNAIVASFVRQYSEPPRAASALRPAGTP